MPWLSIIVAIVSFPSEKKRNGDNTSGFSTRTDHALLTSTGASISLIPAKEGR